MQNIIVPSHRVNQVVARLYENWSERPYRRYCKITEGMYGCYAAFVVNGVVYIDSELYGRFDSVSDPDLTYQVLEIQTPWCNGDYAAALKKLANC